MTDTRQGAIVDTEFITPLGVLAIIESYVEYDIPAVFLGQSVAGQLYLVFWAQSSPGLDIWLMVPISRERLSSVRTGEFSLRESILMAEDRWVWSLSVARDGSSTKLDWLPTNQIPEEYLPGESARLSLQDDRLPTLGEDLVTLARQRGREILCLNIETHTNWLKIDTDRLGLILLDTQMLTTALQAGKRVSRGRYPKDAVDASRLYVSGLAAGSVSVVLESTQRVDMFDHIPSSVAIERLMNLFDSSDFGLTELLQSSGGRVTSRYRSLLRTLVEGDLGLEVRWGSPRTISRKVHLGRQKLKGLLELITKTLPRSVDRLELHGILTGFDVLKGRFNFRADNGERYKGDYHDQFVPRAVHVHLREGLPCTAVIEEVIEVNPTTGAEVAEHLLIDLIPGPPDNVHGEPSNPREG